MTYDPIFTLLPYPGDVMDRSMGSTQIPATSITFANTFGVFFTIALYDLGMVPLAKRLKHPISMTVRIGIGFVVQIAALVAAALIEMARYQAVSAAGVREAFVAAGPDADPLHPDFRHPMRCAAVCTTAPHAFTESSAKCRASACLPHLTCVRRLLHTCASMRAAYGGR